jgi:transcriptional regulatory protein RtcR
MLLRALEEKRFLPVGADREVASDFQLIAGTNRDLMDDVRSGDFREDLLARINLWTFQLPGLAQRAEDIEPNLDHELEAAARRMGRRISIAKDVRAAFLAFARSPQAKWSANFRDLNAAVTRMATLAPAGRITRAILDGELTRLQSTWHTPPAADSDAALLISVLGPDGAAQLDLFDRAQLACVLRTCRASSSLSEAGRQLFSVTRGKRKVTNDADRLRKYLTRFGLNWAKCSSSSGSAQALD